MPAGRADNRSLIALSLDSNNWNPPRVREMSYEDGWAALNLEMPKRIPRTEYSATMHWDLMKVVTGIDDLAWTARTRSRSAHKSPSCRLGITISSGAR